MPFSRRTLKGLHVDSKFILKAIKNKHPKAAIVPELTLEDEDLPDSGNVVRTHSKSYEPRPDGHKYTRRIDALMFESNIRTAFEIKVTREDYMRDTYWKRRAWQKVTHRFIYVVPHDLNVSAPHGCGLWRVHPSGKIEVDKKATINRAPDYLPLAVIQRLAYRAMKAYPF